MKDTKVIFMGTPDFAVPVLQKLIENTSVLLVVTQPDKLVGRKQVLTKSPVKLEAEKYNIPVFQPTKIREDYDVILNTQADIIITCAYGQIIPEAILNYPKFGCINVHASLLPKYRGGAPIHWCLINGEEKTGVTIMYMDKLMDNGDIISMVEYEIKPNDTVLTLHEKLSNLGANLLIDTLPSILNGTNNRIKQNESDVTFAYNIKRSDEELDFNNNGQVILNKIRGLNPWPLANIKIDGIEIKILEASFMKKENSKKTSAIVEIDKNKLGISCKDGIIYLERIKPFGKKEMAIKDFLNGIKKEELLNKKVNG
jgi:methionyl-tRNA formyltransferase